MESERNRIQIEHLSNSISLMGRQTEELDSGLDDLQKVRVRLESELEPIISRFYQVSDVNAKLRENLVKTRKKLDETALHNDEMRKVNGVFDDKAKDYITNCGKERRDLVYWMSEWSEKVTDLSKQFLQDARLYYSDNLIEDLKSKVVETQKMLQEVNQTQFSIDTLVKAKHDLESYMNDCNSLDHFLNSVETALAVASLDNIVKDQMQAKKTENQLLQQKQEIEKLLLEN